LEKKAVLVSFLFLRDQLKEKRKKKLNGEEERHFGF
jgi:hypothetical protein